MFKEAFAGIFILFLFYLLCRSLRKKSNKLLSVLVISILGISCIANIIYNAAVMFPDFYMDTVSGVYRYGTFSGNLFAWSDEFMFQDEIIFPILKNRTVSLDTSADFYEKFISLYAKEYDRIAITDNLRREALSCQEDFDFSHEFSCIGIMDYVTDEIPEELAPSFAEEIYPTLYVNTDSLKGQSHLVFLMEPDYSLYVMGEAYYTMMTGDSSNE